MKGKGVGEAHILRVSSVFILFICGDVFSSSAFLLALR